MSATSNQPTQPFDPRALADLAFATHGSDSRHSRSLAWTAPEDLGIDLDDPAQRRFGDYELIDLLGRGGMGAVYRARQHGLDREVALKFLAAGPWASLEFIERFRREAKAAARMQHPNIVEIFDTGERDGLYYFSMRLVNGPTLSQRLRETGPWRSQDAAKLLRTVAEAIDYAHRLGVLHLDLKPGNILLGANDEPLVADFGLARRIDEGPTGETHEVSGTPSYMAPEQALAKSHPIGPGADIHGLGAVLYELLVGEPPFHGATPQATMQHVVTELPVPPRQRRRDVPADLDAICLKCLEKDPARRYRSARELSAELGRFLDGHAVRVRPLSALQRLWRWTRREPRLAAMFGLVLLSLTLGVVATAREWWRAEAALALAEQNRAEAVEQRAAAELRATRMQQLSGLLAATFSATDDFNDDAITAQTEAAVDWLQRELPNDDTAQGELLKGLAGALLNADKRAAANNLLLQIHSKLGATYWQRVFDVLAASDDPRRWLSAVLAGSLYPREDQHARIDALFQSALARLGEDRLALQLATAFCTTEHCAIPDAPGRLARLDPENLYAWVVQFERTTDLDELLGKAARSTHWDDGYGRIIQALRNARVDSGVPLPAALALPASVLGLDFGGVDAPAYLGSWALPIPVFQRLVEHCDPARGDINVLDRRQRCVRIGHLLADSRGMLLANAIGWAMLRRLEKGTAVEHEMARRRARYVWMGEQDVWSLSGEAIQNDITFLQILVDVGEFEAALRRLDRVGIPRDPPADWKPRDPEALLLPEDRTPRPTP